jgi:hypothetical protein
MVALMSAAGGNRHSVRYAAVGLYSRVDVLWRAEHVIEDLPFRYRGR